MYIDICIKIPYNICKLSIFVIKGSKFMLILNNNVTTELAALDLSFWQVCLRLLCAMVIGLIIGTEREYTHRPAGMRTHILVALGSCAITITGQMLFMQYKGLGGSPDPARLSAQIIAGVGFLGAGTIMREGANVKGLTTAASLWTVAGLGIASGFGYYTIAIAGMIFVFITLTLLEFLQHKFITPSSRLCYFCMETDDLPTALGCLRSACDSLRVDIQNMSAEQVNSSAYKITFRTALGGRANEKRRQEFFDTLINSPSIQSLNVCRDPASASI